MLILFFDTFITAGVGSLGGLYNFSHVEKATAEVRNNFSSFKTQSKIDVVKYTLVSYANIEWDKVIIRFECEDTLEVDSFYDFCKNIFPDAIIQNQRSSTALQYSEALSPLLIYGDPWIFFSPNNDHPYLAHPNELMKYIKILDSVKDLNVDKEVSLLFSHYTESMIDNKISDPQWGYYGSNFKKIIYEDADYIVTASNRAALDSIKVFRLNFLIKIFNNTKNKGRVIRLEDTEFHLQKSKSLITVAPKVELCRHYDSYANLIKYIPPLFIPQGFFESNVKIKYGYDTASPGYVNINPLADKVSDDVDLNCLLEDIPFFWRNRISLIDSNPDFPQSLDKTNLSYYRILVNPFYYRSSFLNILRSIFIIIALPLISFKNWFLYGLISRLKIKKNFSIIKSWFFR
jgi:hypothetical protein